MEDEHFIIFDKSLTSDRKYTQLKKVIYDILKYINVEYLFSEAQWTDILSKARGNSGKTSTEQFIEKLSLVTESIEIVGEYTSSQNGISCRCKVCGNEWKPRASNLLMGRGCPQCARKRKSYSHEEYVEKLNQKNKHLLVHNIYTNSENEMICECLKCGYIWRRKARILLNNSKCPKCKI